MLLYRDILLYNEINRDASFYLRIGSDPEDSKERQTLSCRGKIVESILIGTFKSSRDCASSFPRDTK